MVWRDKWVGVPDVVIFSEFGPHKGKLEDVAVFMRQAVQSPVTLTNKAGQVIKVVIPEEDSGEAAILTELDLDCLEE